MKFVGGKPPLALTIDLEWWGRAHLLPNRPVFPEGIERDIAALERLLELLASHSLNATFFAVAGDFDAAVLRRITSAGHEIASHSMSHPHFSTLPRAAWVYEIAESKKYLEEACSAHVTGFRAPSWSVPYDRRNEFDEVLSDAGYRYDSSFCGMKTPLYGNPAFRTRPYVSPSGLVEIPVPLIGFPKAPWIGGAYFRLAPRFLLKSWIRASRPAFLYFHPWEFYQSDPVKGNLMTRLAIDFGRGRNLRKLSTLIREFAPHVNFCTMDDYSKIARASADELSGR